MPIYIMKPWQRFCIFPSAGAVVVILRCGRICSLALHECPSRRTMEKCNLECSERVAAIMHKTRFSNYKFHSTKTQCSQQIVVCWHSRNTLEFLYDVLNVNPIHFEFGVFHFAGEGGQFEQSVGPNDAERNNNVGDVEQFDHRCYLQHPCGGLHTCRCRTIFAAGTFSNTFFSTAKNLLKVQQPDVQSQSA